MTVPETSDKPYACPVCQTAYWTAEHAAGCADDHQPYRDCPEATDTSRDTGPRVEYVCNVRWQCPCGRFLPESAVHSEDRIDPSAYYGVTSRTWADCKRCGVVEKPRLVEIGRYPVLVT